MTPRLKIFPDVNTEIENLKAVVVKVITKSSTHVPENHMYFKYR